MDPQRHQELTAIRAAAYEDLFGAKPQAVFSALQLRAGEDDPHLIDVFVYPLDVQGIEGPVVAAVTNGMSDERMVEDEDYEARRRREMIQYFRVCAEGHAQRLRDMAWLPLYDEFLLDTRHTIPWEYPAVEGTPWKNAIFLDPIWKAHSEFGVELEGEPVSFLWHIPLSDEEYEYRREHGVDALLDRMQEIRLPWIFDEGNRPSLLA